MTRPVEVLKTSRAALESIYEDLTNTVEAQERLIDGVRSTVAGIQTRRNELALEIFEHDEAIRILESGVTDAAPRSPSIGQDDTRPIRR